MAHVEDRWLGERRGSGLRWRVRWRDPSGRHRTKSFARKADADRFANDVEVRLDRGDYVDPSRGRHKLRDVAGEWWVDHEQTLSVNTAKRYQGILNGRLDKAFGTTAVAAIDYEAVAAWKKQLTDAGLSGSSVRQHLIVLTMVLDHAIRTKRIHMNPVRLVKKPGVTPARRHRYLIAEELDALADECGHYRAFVLLLGYCGLRWSEAIALRPEDIDAARGRVHVERTFAKDGRELVVKPTKTNRRREVPIPDYVLEAIEPGDQLVFTTKNGKVIAAENFRRQVFTPALNRLGLPFMTIHELRHTAASLAVASGAQVLAVANMLGHENPTRTLKVYADLFDDDLDDLRARMDTVARRARAGRGEVVPIERWRRAR